MKERTEQPRGKGLLNYKTIEVIQEIKSLAKRYRIENKMIRGREVTY